MTMQKIESHSFQVNDTVKFMWGATNEDLEDLLDVLRIDNANIGPAFRDAVIQIARSALMERRNHVRFWFHHACDLGVALFEAASPQGENEAQVVTRLLDGRFEIKAGSHAYSQAGYWLDAFFLAAILRRDDAINSLTHHTPTQRGHTSVDRYVEFWADAYPQWLVLDKGDPIGVFELAEGWCEEAKLTPKLAKKMDVHFIRASKALVEQDAATFNTELAHGLEGHKKVRGSGKDRNNLRHLLCFEALGLCSLAYDRNIPIEVESGYIPKWIYEGGCIERPDMQAYVKEVSGS